MTETLTFLLHDHQKPSQQRGVEFIQRCGFYTDGDEISRELEKLERQDPKTFKEYFKQSSRRSGRGRADLTAYQIKNSSKRFSRVVSSSSYAPIWESWMSHMLDRWQKNPSPTPDRILDIGCDVGVSTIFLAALYPESQVVGIDPLPEGIQLAQLLKEKLGIRNVEFLQTTLEDLPSHSAFPPFDLVHSITGMTDRLLTFATQPSGFFLSPDELDSFVHPKESLPPEPGYTIKHVLAPEGVALVIDRLPSIFAVHKVVNAFQVFDLECTQAEFISHELKDEGGVTHEIFPTLQFQHAESCTLFTFSETLQLARSYLERGLQEGFPTAHEQTRKRWTRAKEMQLLVGYAFIGDTLEEHSIVELYTSPTTFTLIEWWPSGKFQSSEGHSNDLEQILDHVECCKDIKSIDHEVVKFKTQEDRAKMLKQLAARGKKSLDLEFHNVIV